MLFGIFSLVVRSLFVFAINFGCFFVGALYGNKVRGIVVNDQLGFVNTRTVCRFFNDFKQTILVFGERFNVWVNFFNFFRFLFAFG